MEQTDLDYRRRRQPRFEAKGIISKKLYNKRTNEQLTFMVLNVSEDGLQLRAVDISGPFTNLIYRDEQRTIDMEVVWSKGEVFGLRKLSPQLDLIELFGEYIL